MSCPVLSLEVEQLWSEQAKQISWISPWDRVLDWNEPYAQWFVGGKLNASHACLDAHLNSWRKNKIALYWEDEDGNTVALSYLQLWSEVNRFASALQTLGVTCGDRVILYLPMIPQSVVAMLACARIGAIHSIVFSSFGSSALADRIKDIQAQFVITADFCKRRGKLIPLKAVVDQALESISEVKHVVVVKRSSQAITLVAGRDVLYDELMQGASSYIAPLAVDSQHPLFILHTSGTTGKPKGIVHATGGYLVYAYSTYQWAFNIQEDSTYWCTADVGWITGHSFVVYAPLLHGATILLYEGSPDYPNIEVWWKLIEKYRVSIFYTAPTALRMFMRYGTEFVKKYDMSSLRVLGTVGEVINPGVWEWFFTNVGGGRCPIIDTWFQTETGGFMIAPAAGLHLVNLKPGSATFSLPGIEADVVDEHGTSVAPHTKGYLVIKKPWPGMLVGIYNNPEGFKQIYWNKFKGMYYSGDYAKKDSDGYFWLLGRADETLKVAGHLLGTAEIESAVIATPFVAEAAVISVPDEIKGEAIVLFVVLKQEFAQGSDLIEKDIIESIRCKVGALAKPKEIYFVERLPKTRSGKIMRRVLKAIAMGSVLGDLSTLEDEVSVDEIKTTFYALKNIVQRQGSL